MKTELSMADSSKQFGGDKIFQHLDRLAAWQGGKLMPPVTVELDLTNNCNHSCPNCTFSYLVNIDKSSIPFDLAQKIVADLGAFGVKAVTFSGGGEPLVYGESRVLDLVKRCNDARMSTALITNGSKLTDPEFLYLCEWVRVSLDGYDEATFERFHGRSAKEFEKVCDRLRSFCAMKKNSRCTVGAGFLTTTTSVENGHFWHMAKFCSEQFPGLDYLQFRPLVVNMVDDPTLTGGGWDTFSDEMLEATLCEYRRAAKAFSREDFKVLISEGKYEALATPGFGKTYSMCHAHFMEAVVSADAKVYVCCHTQGQEAFCLGDLKEKSFAEIWHSEKAREVASSFDPKTTCPPACRLHLQNSTLEQIGQGVTHPNFI